MKKILVIDGNSIINRAFYGVRPLTTKSGKNTNAVFGMINIISRQIEAVAPDYAAVAFDLKAPTFRHEMFPEYKAGRSPTPPELKEQFPDAKECLSLMGLHVMELPGYEADDIQGTVASMAHCNDDTESYILTGDRDLLQLIDDKITVLLATNNDTKVMKRGEFSEKYGIAPEYYVQMKALMGDSSDNIPGVRGIGEKTAATLIANFSTLEAIYENIDDERITKSVRTKLTEGKDSAFLSRDLAKIDVNAPIGMTLEDLRIKPVDKKGLYKKFTELELNSFIAKFKLNVTDDEDNNADDISDDEPIPQVSELGADVLSELCEKTVAMAYDGETARIFDEKRIYVTAQKDFIEKILDSKHDVICYDAKALIHALYPNIKERTPAARLLDLSLYAYVLNPGSGTAGIPALASMFISRACSPECDGVHLYFDLERAMREKITSDGLTYVLDELEIPLCPILARTEATGFKIDVNGMNEFSAALLDLEDELKAKIYERAGGEFNVNSPKQLGEVLFVKLGLPTQKKKNKNGFSTDAATLEELRPYAPIIDDILEYRQVAKLRGTYAAALPLLADAEGRIHTEFKQSLTATGRLSSAEPNLQNIPIKTKMGRQMRKYFVAREGYTLVDADYSQIELRLLAHISEDYNMSEAFREGVDIHAKTAAAVFGVSEEEVTPEMRKKAKAVNFGIIYGISGFSLSKDIGTSVAEAKKYIKNYLMNYPFIDSYLENVVKEATELGYTKTPLGRRRYIPELNNSNGAIRAFGKRIAMNAPIQGAAADVMKLGMINAYRALTKEIPDAHIVMQVHDELVVEAPIDKADEVKRILTEAMADAYKISVPLTVDATCGTNWLDQE